MDQPPRASPTRRVHHDENFGAVVTRAGATQALAPLQPDTPSLRRFLAAIRRVIFDYLLRRSVSASAAKVACPSALDPRADEDLAIDALLSTISIRGKVRMIDLTARGRRPWIGILNGSAQRGETL